MGKILGDKRVVGYSKDFKVKVVKLTRVLDIDVVTLATVLGLHPVMVYRWRQEYKEGKLRSTPTDRVDMTLKRTTPKPTKKKRDELERLKQENLKLKKENDLLKKWQRYLNDLKRNDSDS